MRDERRGDDSQAIWQNQPTEIPTMTLKLIQSKGRELQAKTRRKWLGTAAGPLAVVFSYAFAAGEFPSLGRLQHALFALALGWSVAGLYFLNRGIRFTPLTAGAGLRTGLEFCRSELGRRRRLLQGLLLWSLAPILLSIGTFLWALAASGTHEKALLPNGVPFLSLVAIWIVGYFVMRVREQRELTREIDELNDLEGDVPRDIP